ncbi:hypothetical protein ACS5NO_24545 [Larkinella sp. GY13]|uniref:hypothetical protein n=1 Tax=Larkinella sp. GY13 TaxID=3453720 RepID=UPI003EE86148
MEEKDYIKERVKFLTEILKLLFSLFLITVAGSFVSFQQSDYHDKYAVLFALGTFFWIFLLIIIAAMTIFLLDYIKILNR